MQFKSGGRYTTSQRAVLSFADILLIPFVPRSFDVWTLEKVSALVAEMKTINPKLKAYAFINRADPRGQDNAEASEVIRENQEKNKILKLPKIITLTKTGGTFLSIQQR